MHLYARFIWSSTMRFIYIWFYKESIENLVIYLFKDTVSDNGGLLSMTIVYFYPLLLEGK